MGSNKTRVITVRISNEAATAIELEAERNGKGMKELIEMLGIDISEGRLRCNTDSFVPPEEHLDELSPVPDDLFDYTNLKFDKVLSALRRNDYPDRVIRQMNEMQITQISNNGKYNPKRFGDDAC